MGSSASLIGMLGGPMLQGLFGGGQDRQSFEGTAVDPIAMLRQSHELLAQLGHGITDRATQPISLPSAYAQQPGSYTGGGLPMPIGLVAQDPALANPGLLTLPGMDEFRALFPNGSAPPPQGPQGPTSPPYEQPPPQDPNNGDPTQTNLMSTLLDGPRIIPAGPNQGGPTGRSPVDGGTLDGPRLPPQRPSLVRGQDLIAADEGQQTGDPGDDLTRAYGAVNLLLHAMGQQ